MKEIGKGRCYSFKTKIEELYNDLGPLLLKYLRGEPFSSETSSSVRSYQLDGHLNAMKRYILCERGDFIQSLMDGLDGELSKPATLLYRHNLIGNLDDSVKQCLLSQFESKDVLDRLDVRLLKVINWM